MSKKIHIAIVIILCFMTNLKAQEAEDSLKSTFTDSLNANDETVRSSVAGDTKATSPVPLTYPVVVNRAFEFGEKLIFKIRYGFIRAGTAEMKVSAKIDEQQRKLYHMQTTAKSLSSFNWIYKVDDEVNSFVDYHGFYPIRFEKKLREGSYSADLFVDYFHEDSLAKVEFIRHKQGRKPKYYEVTIPPFVQDVLSAFYFIRTCDLKVGESVYLSNHEKDKVYDLEVRVHKRENVEVEAGKFRCLVVEPMLQGDESLFKQKGQMTIYLTDDERKIPVLMKTKIVVGHITTELMKMEGVTKDIPAKLD